VRIIVLVTNRRLASVASPGFGARRGTERHRNNLSRRHIIYDIYTVIQKYLMRTFHFFNKNKKNELIVITAARKF